MQIFYDYKQATQLSATQYQCIPSFSSLLFCQPAPPLWFEMLPIFQLLPPGLPHSLRQSALPKASAATAPSKSAAPRGCRSSGMPRWIGRSPTPTSCDTWTSFWATR